MRTFTRSVTRFLESFLSPYAPGWNVDYASFRPQQEEGRRVKFKARNDLLHVDAFPTRPTRGDRIFRFFLNINPVESRRWVTSDTFERLLGTYVGTPEMPFPAAQEGIHSRWSRHLSRWGKALGLPLAAPSRYDDFMLRLHDHLKANRKFQQAEARYRLEFPPGSSWMVFTDFVPHAALSGQFALEQTLVIGRPLHAAAGEGSDLSTRESQRRQTPGLRLIEKAQPMSYRLDEREGGGDGWVFRLAPRAGLSARPCGSARPAGLCPTRFGALEGLLPRLAVGLLTDSPRRSEPARSGIGSSPSGSKPGRVAITRGPGLLFPGNKPAGRTRRGLGVVFCCRLAREPPPGSRFG